MYVDRLGAVRAARMNPFAALASAGVTLAFGADSPVCAIDPWGGVRAATGHQTPAHRVSTDVAFAAATRGGRLAAGEDEAGVLVAGAPATFAIWDSAEVDAPTCLRTVVRGRTVHSVEEAMA
jgi:predicted amidohydrolase YtcJ